MPGMGNRWLDYRMGGRHVQVRIIKSRNVVQFRNEWTWEIEVPLQDLFSNFPISSLHAMFDPILKARFEIERGQRKKLLASLRQQVKRRDGTVCAYCAAEGGKVYGPDKKPWHIDHVVPRSKGGKDELDNLVLACASCNIAKSDKDPDEL